MDYSISCHILSGIDLRIQNLSTSCRPNHAHVLLEYRRRHLSIDSTLCSNKSVSEYMVDYI